MRAKLAFIAGGAVGYVLGTRDGRERYEQIMNKAQDLWTDPAVRDQVKRVSDQATEAATTAAAKAAAVAKEQADKVSHD